MSLIHPKLSDKAFLKDVRSADDPSRLYVWWLGQSGFLIKWRGSHLVFDPYLSDALTKKYANTDKPHVRMTARVVDPAALDFIDVVTSSHNHTDHLDAETLRPMLAANPSMQLVIPEANREFVANRLKIDATVPIGLDDGMTKEIGPFTFHAVPAAHEEIQRDDFGRSQYLGYVVEVGPWTLYHSGDTMLYEGIEDCVGQWPIDIAFLPINGRKPERRVAGNLNGKEAAGLAKAIRAAEAIPCHYEMFEFNTESPASFMAEAERLGQSYLAPLCGARASFRRK